jgi:multidrug resistance protein
MSIDLNASPTVINLSVAFYMLAMSIFPLWWSSFSEIYGRRSIYILSFALFVVFSIASAVSTDIAMLIVFRLMGGGASASVQAVGAGTIADIWEPRERGTAMGIFYLGPLMGPLLAPIIGGALAQAFGWASTMWCLAIYGGILLILLLFCLPETLPKRKPAASSPQADQAQGSSSLALKKTASSVSVHAKKTAKFMQKIFLEPLQVLLYLRHPPVAITVYYAAITFGSLFALNISVQQAFSIPPYDFSQMIVGLLYIPSAVGYILASVLGGRWIDRIMAREARRAGRYDDNGKLIYLPEDRMRENAWIAGTVYPASLIFWGWTIDAGIYWLVPCVGLFTFGAGAMLVFSGMFLVF